MRCNGASFQDGTHTNFWDEHLVPRRSDLDWFNLCSPEHRKSFRGDEEFDAASLAGLTTDEPLVLQFDNHAVHAGRCDPEEPFHIGFRRRSAIQYAVGVDECEVLALFFS